MTTDAKEVQRRLTEWGAACRAQSERLGLPGISQIQIMIEHVQREDRLRRGVRQTRRREQKRTATGKGTKAARRPAPILNSAIMEVDYLIAAMPDRALKAVLVQAYLYGRPDRSIAKALRISKARCRLWREAAEESLGARLATRAVNVKIPGAAIVTDFPVSMPPTGASAIFRGKLSLK